MQNITSPSTPAAATGVDLLFASADASLLDPTALPTEQLGTEFTAQLDEAIATAMAEGISVTEPMPLLAEGETVAVEPQITAENTPTTGQDVAIDPEELLQQLGTLWQTLADTDEVDPSAVKAAAAKSPLTVIEEEAQDDESLSSLEPAQVNSSAPISAVSSMPIAADASAITATTDWNSFSAKPVEPVVTASSEQPLEPAMLAMTSAADETVAALNPALASLATNTATQPQAPVAADEVSFDEALLDQTPQTESDGNVATFSNVTVSATPATATTSPFATSEPQNNLEGNTQLDMTPTKSTPELSGDSFAALESRALFASSEAPQPALESSQDKALTPLQHTPAPAAPTAARPEMRPAELPQTPIPAQQVAPALSERLQMMINTDNLSAEIRLDPPELGAMQVRIQVQGDQANVQIVTQQAQARDLLEQALPRLRELLQQQGLTLGEAQIQQQAQQGDQQAGNSNGNGRGNDAQGVGHDGQQEHEPDNSQAIRVDGRNSDGNIDLFA
ncbi:MAG: flagellar hook-length control protein FliK [Ferrimonas sp.]